MKKTNKGFSMVELIIVIAIMAILAGALAPALIKYINKSRVSTDIQTGNTIATACQTALSNEKGYDDASSSTYNATWVSMVTLWGNSDNFADSVKSTVGGNAAPGVKSKKCIAKTGAVATGGPFEIYVDPVANTVKVRMGGNHLIYPTADDCLTNEVATACSASAT